MSTTPILTWNTTGNVTASSTVTSDPASLHAKYTTISVVGVFTNVLLVLIIFLSKTLRRKPFFWNILSLCFVDSVMVTFVIPLGLDYELDWKWTHGKWMCKVWMTADIFHILMAGIVLVCICCDRILAKLQTLTSVSARISRLMPIAFASFPWIFLVLVCVPFIVSIQKIEPDEAEEICYYSIKEETIHVFNYFTLVVPNILLIVALNLMLFVFIIKGGQWTRISSDDMEDDDVKLRMSVLSVWALSSVCLVCWLPIAFLATFLLHFAETCQQQITWDIYSSTYTLQLVTSAISPLFWLILPEVRHELAIWRKQLIKLVNKYPQRCHKRNAEVSFKADTDYKDRSVSKENIV